MRDVLRPAQAASTTRCIGCHASTPDGHYAAFSASRRAEDGSPSQVEHRSLDGTAKKLGLPQSRVVVTVDRHANTSAASIPLALDEAVRDGRIRQGHLLLLEAMGGGFTWGASLVRW